MVRFYFYLLLFFCGMGLPTLEASPIIDASIDSMSSRAHFPLEGTITVTRSKEEKIDPHSFQIEGKPLEVSFVKDVSMSASPDTLVSLYSFQLPAQEKGLYVLPSISVQVGGQTYRTVPSTYEVKEEMALPSSSSSTTPSSPPIFRLEASVKGPSTLYPGERTKLFYRISYNRSVDLTRSDLPMVHPAHFEKVGDVQIRNNQQLDVTVQDLIQEVEASDLGTFQLGPSFIEGYAYTMAGDQKIYDSHLLRAEAPAVTVEVKPFPSPHQPASFTGALGQIKADAHLESSSSVFVGDLVQLQVKIEGISNLAELRLPALPCQPGFSGFFQTSDLPPLAEIKDNAKIFHVELRPLTSLIHQIPSIEVSSFDPASGKYVMQQIPPLPLTVQSHPFVKKFLLPPSLAILKELASVNQWPSPRLLPLEFEGIPIHVTEIKSFWEGSPWLFWLFPLGLGLLLLQKRWHEQWKKRTKSQVPKSEELLRRAFQTDSLHSLKSLQLLEEAFWHRLWEKGIAPQGMFQLDQLPQSNQLEPIRSFLLQLEALQYSADQTFDPSGLKENALRLFKTI